jgi:hypothetical protein
VLIFFILQSLLADYGSWYLMTLGIIGIVIMLFAPRGLLGPDHRQDRHSTFPRSAAAERWASLRSRNDTKRKQIGGIDSWLRLKPTF